MLNLGFIKNKTPPLDKSGWLAGWLAFLIKLGFIKNKTVLPDKTRFQHK